MITTSVEFNVLFQASKLAIDPRSEEACLRQLLKFLLELALSPADQRRQDHDALVGTQSHDLLDDLLRRLS